MPSLARIFPATGLIDACEKFDDSLTLSCILLALSLRHFLRVTPRHDASRVSFVDGSHAGYDMPLPASFSAEEDC